MPRGVRLDAPGTLHHVIVREIERRKIGVFYGGWSVVNNMRRLGVREKGDERILGSGLHSHSARIYSGATY